DALPARPALRAAQATGQVAISYGDLPKAVRTRKGQEFQERPEGSRQGRRQYQQLTNRGKLGQRRYAEDFTRRTGIDRSNRASRSCSNHLAESRWRAV